ncbi:MAG TPA: hypothetical protein VGI19_09585 [Candidatus Cybelea sp.]|jgi:hypothetical protein
MTAWKIVAIFALGLLGIAALRDLGRLGDSLPWHRLYDFPDFYCAGTAINQGADPYRYEPLHRCEHTVNRGPLYRADPSRVVPAPLPPYDFPPLRLLARLRFEQARALQAIAIVLAVAGSIAGLAALGVALDVAALALILPAGYLLLDAGQIVPFALLLLVFCGLALSRRQDATAGALAALMLLEPHLGLPVFAAILLFVPRGRIAALITALLLLGISTMVAGTSGIAEYVLRVLPAQAAAEAGYVYQYSLTYLVSHVGLATQAALLLGEVSYALMLVFGVWLGARLAMDLQRRELLAYLPAAFSVLGGSYVHMIDLPIAIPAALILTIALRGRAQVVASLTVCLLAVPWIAVWIDKKLFLACLFVVGALLMRLKVRPAIALATFAAVAVVVYVFELHPPPPFPSTAATATFSPADLAQVAWGAYVNAIGDPSPGWLLIKLPTWGALLALLGVAWSATARRLSQS